jgi:hypothetical protein
MQRCLATSNVFGGLWRPAGRMNWSRRNRPPVIMAPTRERKRYAPLAKYRREHPFCDRRSLDTARSKYSRRQLHDRSVDVAVNRHRLRRRKPYPRSRKARFPASRHSTRQRVLGDCKRAYRPNGSFINRALPQRRRRREANRDAAGIACISGHCSPVSQGARGRRIAGNSTEG